jgi:hypothetical protein
MCVSVSMYINLYVCIRYNVSVHVRVCVHTTILFFCLASEVFIYMNTMCALSPASRICIPQHYHAFSLICVLISVCAYAYIQGKYTYQVCTCL